MPLLSPCATDDIYMVIKSLLACRLNSTLAELKRDYDEKVGDNRLPRSYKDLRRLMKSMEHEHVECITDHKGLEMWQIKRTSSTSHETKYKYMKKGSSQGGGGGNVNGASKRPRRRNSPSSNRRTKSRTSTSNASSVNSQETKPKRPCHNNRHNNRQPLRTQTYQKLHYDESQQFLSDRNKIDLDGYLHNYQLMGDDFLLSLAKIDLGYKFEKDPKTGRLGIGYCLSGLTIKDLTKLMRTVDIAQHVIVYVGTVDILQNRSLENIKADYCDLLSAFREQGVEPLLCTLAPIGDAANIYNDVIKEFNLWLTNRNWTVVDVDRCFIDNDGMTIRSLYQKDPRDVSGCSVQHLLWNKLGRQRAIRRMKQFIGYDIKYRR